MRSRFIARWRRSSRLPCPAAGAQVFACGGGENRLQSLVRQAIDRLPEPYRTVRLLRDIEELDTEETARVLGLNANTVKTRLHRARQALQALLDPICRKAL